MPYFRGFREHWAFFRRAAFPTFPSFLHTLMAHPSGWSNRAQAKQQTVQRCNATVVHAAAWQVQLAERD
jgi:hypothetical protein